ncbi:ABC transporter substrate-binding protein [Actinoplanes couchii]|uniref:ABC transporter substrate-binding protein n=2 Tax=Actinoplanes couchii TaxID=403638 RepID=A0ABQ3XRB3_9ACTN|nr:ABC transporter substrate-binding protein [Actinoplanes couchii]
MFSLVVVLGVAGGCSRGAASPASSTPPAGTTITNCGRTVSVTTAPQRALTLEQNATEILLSLGLSDRMIGTSYQTDPVLPELTAAYDAVPKLADLYPNREAVLQARPDFVYSTFTSAYATDAAGPRAELADLKIPAYLSRFACEDPTTGEKAVTFDGILAEITEIAGVFGVDGKGAEIVAAQRARLDAVKGAGTDTTEVLWYYSGTTTPYVAGPNGLPAAISTHLGVRNTYGDASQTWPAGNWEQIAQRDPDVIVLADLTRGGDGDSAAAKAEFLRTNPVTAQLDAVRNNRLVTVSGSSMDPSIRSVTAVEQVATALKEFGK